MPIHLLQIAKKLAHDAGHLALDYQKKGFNVHNKKGRFDKVTDADKACQELIVNTIRHNFPSHGIIAEEDCLIEAQDDIKWIIDPIDGTSNFIHGIPLFAVSIAVVQNGKPIIGVVEIPALKENFWAKLGEGAFLNGKRIHVSHTSELENAMLATGFPYEREEKLQKNLAHFAQFSESCLGVRRMGSAVIDLAYVAAGRFDGFWEYDLEAWDIAAGKILIEEAGGTISNMDGSKLDPKQKNLLASNGILHQKLMQEITASLAKIK